MALALSVMATGCDSGVGLKLDTSSEQSPVDVPNFTLPNLQEQPVTLSSFQGKSPVLIMFWATWCPYCQQEIPKLNELRKKYSTDQLAILGIDIDESLEHVKDYVARFKIQYEVLIDADAQVSAEYGVEGVPTFILIDRAGRGVIADHGLSRKILSTADELVQGI